MPIFMRNVNFSFRILKSKKKDSITIFVPVRRVQDLLKYVQVVHKDIQPHIVEAKIVSSFWSDKEQAVLYPSDNGNQKWYIYPN